MRKKGIIKTISIFVILFLLLVGILYWFFMLKNSKEDFAITKISIIPGSVFVNKALQSVIFDITINNKNENLTYFKIFLKDENGKTYSENFTEALNESLTKSIIMNYTNTEINNIKKIFIVPTLLNQKGEKTVIEYNLSETDFKSIGCNNDGILNINEECDDGNHVNNDDCLNTCNLASCGDRFVQKKGNKTEECDRGTENSDILSDACRTDCTLSKCGDKVIDSGEECDLNNFGEFKEGIDMCANYSLRYNSGNLNCRNCEINTNNCKEVIRALQLNGINESVDLSTLNLEKNKTYIFSVWVKHEGKGYGQSIIGCTNSYISLRTINRGYTFRVVTDQNSTEKEAIAQGANRNKWDHIVAVHSQSSAKIYLNGYTKDSKFQNGKIKSDIKCRIGSYYDGKSRHFKGMVDDLRIYDKILSNKEILQLYNDGQNSDTLIEGLMGRWKFDDGSGIIVKDSSGEGRNGKLKGNPRWIVENFSR